MKNNNSKNIVRPYGRNVYVDSKNRDVIYDFFSKKYYFLPAEKYKNFNLYKNRFVIILAIMMIAYTFIKDYKTAIISAIGFAIIFEIAYRKRFINKLEVVENFVPDKKPLVKDIATKEDTPRIITKLILYVLLAVLLIINAIQQNYSLAVNVLSGVFAAVSFVTGFVYLFAFLEKRNQQPKNVYAKKFDKNSGKNSNKGGRK